MPTEKEEKQPQKQTCTWISLLVVVLLLALAYFAIYRDKKTVKSSTRGGGYWSAKGGCGCMPPR